jgi:hypothetical protein
MFIEGLLIVPVTARNQKNVNVLLASRAMCSAIREM